MQPPRKHRGRIATGRNRSFLRTHILWWNGFGLRQSGGSRFPLFLILRIFFAACFCDEPIQIILREGVRTTVADALLDWLLHGAHRLELKGDLLRKKAAALTKVEGSRTRLYPILVFEISTAGGVHSGRKLHQEESARGTHCLPSC